MSETEAQCYVEWREYRQAIFNHFAQEHGLTLLESEMAEIENLILAGPTHQKLIEAKNQLRDQLEQRDKCCGEMREALKSHHEWSCHQSKHNEIVYTGSLRAETEHALSSDCGKNMVSIEQVRVLKEALEAHHNLEKDAWEKSQQALDLIAKIPNSPKT